MEAVSFVDFSELDLLVKEWKSYGKARGSSIQPFAKVTGHRLGARVNAPIVFSNHIVVFVETYQPSYSTSRVMSADGSWSNSTRLSSFSSGPVLVLLFDLGGKIISHELIYRAAFSESNWFVPSTFPQSVKYITSYMNNNCSNGVLGTIINIDDNNINKGPAGLYGDRLNSHLLYWIV